jgi:hypothetical protein
LTDKPKRDWLETFIDVAAAIIISGTVVFILFLFYWILRLVL